MLKLQTLLSLPVFIATTLIAHALASNDGFIDADKEPKSKLGASLTGGEGCNDKQIKGIRDGFLEMNDLFQSALPMNWDGDAEREYFGTRERLSNYTALVESNIRRAARYANLEGNKVKNPDIHIRCDDPVSLCDEGNKHDGRYVAYNIANDPHINFCNRYFDLDPLEKTVRNVAKSDSMNMDLMAYYNRATAWARQVMHISAVGTAVVARFVGSDPGANSSSPWMTSMFNVPMNMSFLAGVMNGRPMTPFPNNVQSLKYAYGATRAKLLAVLSTQEPYDAPNNAESYALYAQARYVMKEKNIYPNKPIIKFDSEYAVLMNNQLQEGEQKKYACFDEADVAPRNRRTESKAKTMSSSASTINLRSWKLTQWEAGSSLAALCTAFCMCILAFLSG